MGMFSSSVMMIAGSGGGGGSSSLAISANSEDGYDNNGSWNASFHFLGNFLGAIRDGGCRFLGTASNPLPPQGATITAGADFQVGITFVGGSGSNVIVQGNDADDAGFWNGVGPATMPVTTANVTRTLGTVQRESFDVTTILQELVNRGSWVGGVGGHLAIGILDNGSGSSNSNTYDGLDDSTGNEATLDFSWT